MTTEGAGAARHDAGAPAVRASDDLRRVATHFLEHGADSLPCLDAEGRVVGRITRERRRCATRDRGRRRGTRRKTTATVPQRSMLPYVVLGGIAVVILWALVASGMWTDMLRYRKDVVYLTKQHLFLVGVSGVARHRIRRRPRDLVVAAVDGPVRGSDDPGRQHGHGDSHAGKLALMMGVPRHRSPSRIVGLWIATLLPIIRNTYVGIRSVPEHLIDAAHGMGMSPARSCAAWSCRTRCS